MSPSPEAERSTAVDLLVVFGLTLLAAKLWGDCAATSELAGDSFVPLQCGRDFLLSGWALPSQNIFGWGLCATYAPLFAGAESLVEVARRRALLQALVVPATWCTARYVLQSATPFTRRARRIGALCAGFAVLLSPGVGVPSASGGHGYLAWPWVGIATAGLAWACRHATHRSWGDRAARALAAAVGAAAIPMAAMNHPFTAWLAVSALVLLPLGVARAGIGAVLAAAAAAAAVAWPQVLILREKASAGDTWGSFANQPGSERLMDPEAAVAWLGGSPEGVLILGFGALVFALPFLAGEGRRFAAGSWALSGIAGGLAIVALGSRVGYLQGYHVMTLYPFAGLGLAAGAAALVDAVERRTSFRGAALLTGGLLVGLITVGSDLSEADRPWNRPWCPMPHLNGGTVGGVGAYEAALREDLETAGTLDPFLLTDFNLGNRRVDGSVALGLSLHMGGVPVERMTCCRGDESPTWYLIGDLGDDRLGWGAVLAVEGIDPVLIRPEVSEILVAVRTDAALSDLGDLLCAWIPPDQKVAVHYYEELEGVFKPNDGPGLPTPSPTPSCLVRTQ